MELGVHHLVTYYWISALKHGVSSTLQGQLWGAYEYHIQLEVGGVSSTTKCATWRRH